MATKCYFYGADFDIRYCTFALHVKLNIVII